jgi:hypothetical protein
MAIFHNVPTAISSVYSHHQWDVWKFSSLPSGWWNDKTNQREFLQTISNRLFPTLDYEHWYKLTSPIIITNGGRPLLKLYNGSVLQLLESAFPEHTWLPWKFKQLPRSYWTVKENVDKYMGWLATELGMADMEDWYKVTKATFDKNHGTLYSFFSCIFSCTYLIISCTY